MKVVIVGGVAGGASAAARIRRLDEHAQIIMIERSGYVSYANCGLPYYVGGVIKEQEELTLQTPEGFWDRFRIDVRVRQEVTAINRVDAFSFVRLFLNVSTIRGWTFHCPRIWIWAFNVSTFRGTFYVMLTSSAKQEIIRKPIKGLRNIRITGKKIDYSILK